MSRTSSDFITILSAILLIGAGAQAQPLGWQLTEKQDALTDESITTATLVDGALGPAKE
jgi:hypothetical protein